MVLPLPNPLFENSIIKLEKVSLTLEGPAGPVNILRELDLSVASGETISVVGPSGSGKTSLLMVIAGLEKPSSGLARVNGVKLNTLDEDELSEFRRENVGIVFQNFHLVPTMSALENVALPLEFSGRDDAISQAKTALKSVGLTKRINHYPGQLSGGEQQRVAIARAFIAKPKLLLADEPTGNLDTATSEVVINFLFELAEQQGTTLFLITHDVMIGARCNREIQISDGQIQKRTIP